MKEKWEGKWGLVTMISFHSDFVWRGNGTKVGREIGTGMRLSLSQVPQKVASITCLLWDSIP